MLFKFSSDEKLQVDVGELLKSSNCTQDLISEVVTESSCF
jgi:hypothetical protein